MTFFLDYLYMSCNIGGAYAMVVRAWGPATLDDLYKVEGKVELIGGRIVHLLASGILPSDVAFEIALSLRAFTKHTGSARAFGDGVGYSLDPPLMNGRQSFSPDASYYRGPLPGNPMRFIEGPPTFAVEVRSENDYGDAAEKEFAEKRADYFEAGTLVVWDVDPVAKTVAVYRQSDPLVPTIYRANEIAEADPAVPGWSMAVNDIFP